MTDEELWAVERVEGALKICLVVLEEMTNLAMSNARPTTKVSMVKALDKIFHHAHAYAEACQVAGIEAWPNTSKPIAQMVETYRETVESITDQVLSSLLNQLELHFPDSPSMN